MDPLDPGKHSSLPKPESSSKPTGTSTAPTKVFEDTQAKRLKEEMRLQHEREQEKLQVSDLQQPSYPKQSKFVPEYVFEDLRVTGMQEEMKAWKEKESSAKKAAYEEDAARKKVLSSNTEKKNTSDH